MNRQKIVETIGAQYMTANIEEDEYSYAKVAGSKAKLEELVGHPVEHYKLDRRFEHNTDTGDFVILVETKQNFNDADIDQLKAYLELERALNKGRKVICILANTTANDDIKVWKSEINDEHLLQYETVLESMEYYESLFAADRQNDREKVMKNTYMSDEEKKDLMTEIKEDHIFGIENENKAYGLSTTNMLIHGDGNSNIEFGSCFDKKEFIKKAKPDIVLMNPPYNQKPRNIPDRYKASWTQKQKDGKEEPTKGFVFVKYLSDTLKAANITGTKLAVLLPMSAAIGGNSNQIKTMKKELLQDNTLEAVFSLPAELFYPGASVQACCMLFTMGIPHDSRNHETFFGYYKDDGFIKRKNMGRVEQFDNEGHSRWKQIEEEWLSLFHNKSVVDGLSAKKKVKWEDEWLCEAYMKTDYSALTERDFQNTVNDFLSSQIEL